jgi:penicillin-binding protein 1A
MLQGAVSRGTAARTVGTLDLNLAGKTGTTNEAKDVWFIGYSPRIAAGCFMGYDNPRPMGDDAFGGTLCAPIFQEFIAAAMEGQGPAQWDAPPGGYWIKVDRTTGQRLSDNATGGNVQAEYVRDGQERVAIGEFAQTVDGGWKMGSDVPLVDGATGAQVERVRVGNRTRVLPTNPGKGALSSGGLY